VATTPNYGIEIPDVGADVGAWGSIANAAFNAFDSRARINYDTAVAAQNTANSALSAAQGANALATTVQSALAAKILISTAAPTGANDAPDGTLWCVV